MKVAILANPRNVQAPPVLRGICNALVARGIEPVLEEESAKLRRENDRLLDEKRAWTFSKRDLESRAQS